MVNIKENENMLHKFFDGCKRILNIYVSHRSTQKAVICLVQKRPYLSKQ